MTLSRPETGSADRLEQALADDLKPARPHHRRALNLGALDYPPDGLAELRGVLMNEHEWRQREGLGR